MGLSPYRPRQNARTAPRCQSRTDQSAAHSALVNEVLLWLGDRDDMLVWRNVVGVFRRVRGDPMIYTIGTPGQADIMGVWLRLWGRKMFGQMIAVEVKTGAGRLSKKQQAWRDALLGVGGLYFVVRSLTDAQHLWPKRSI